MVQKIWRKAKVEWVCQIGRHYICTILKSGIEDGQNVPQYIYSDKSDLFSVIKVFLSVFTVATPTWWILSRGNKVFGVYLQWQTWFVLRANIAFLGVFTVTNLTCPEGQQSIFGCIYSDKPDLSWGPSRCSFHKHNLSSGLWCVFWCVYSGKPDLSQGPATKGLFGISDKPDLSRGMSGCFLGVFVLTVTNLIVQRAVKVFLGCICIYSDKPDCPEGCQGVSWVYLHLH